MSRGSDLYRRARHRIPGGSQLLSKQPERFLPGQWPAYYDSARGVEVEDLDGRTFVDVTINAVGACPLGYADPDVEAAVIAAVRSGNMTTLNCPEEVELAEVLCELHPFADMVRYTRGGADAMAVAVRIARAATGRSRVAFCGYHGWHDWYLAANLADRTALDRHLLPSLDPAGVAESLAGTAAPFDIDSLAELEDLAAAEPLAAIILEPARYELPPREVLIEIRELARRLGAVLIFDEITSGFRMATGGVHQLIGVAPDVAVFAKAMSNGFPMGAVIGRREVMQVAEQSFISSTYWSERIGPVAALATIAKFRRCDVAKHLIATGDRMRAGIAKCAAAHGLSITQRGIAPLPTFSFEHGDDSLKMATLYTQLMLDAGFLASGAFYATFAHAETHVVDALRATDRSFAAIRAALEHDRLDRELRGPVAEVLPGRRGTRAGSRALPTPDTGREPTLPYGRQTIDEDDIDAVVRVLRGDRLTTGPAVERFEAALATAVGAEGSVAVSSGTAALHAACFAAGVGPGDRVIVPAVTFLATANCVRFLGGEPIFADVDAETGLIDPTEVERIATECDAAGRQMPLRAVIPVHLNGAVADVAAVHRLASTAGARVIEDAAHALGAVRDGAPVGRCAPDSDMAIFSFHPVKHITTGEGGAVASADPELLRRLRGFRNHGIEREPERFDVPSPGPWYYEQQFLGHNLRLSDIHAALGYSQLNKLAVFLDRRRALAARYDQLLQSVPGLCPAVPAPAAATCAYHLYPVLIPFREMAIDRGVLMRRLEKRGIATQVHYIPLPMQPYYRDRGWRIEEFPGASRYYERALSLPLFPTMADTDVDRVVACLEEELRDLAAF